MQARHILLKTKYLVPTIMQALQQGADFAQLARDHSACPSAQNGGDWGRLDQQVLPENILQALNEADIGDVMGPIESRHGLHILKLES
jgi:peptidyl-prolyl cis-trans isomerase C